MMKAMLFKFCFLIPKQRFRRSGGLSIGFMIYSCPFLSLPYRAVHTFTLLLGLEVKENFKIKNNILCFMA